MVRISLNRLLILAVWLMPASVWSQEPEITVELSDGVRLEMVWIEPGTFTMGAEPDISMLYSGHGPQHRVTLTQGFYLGKFELTQAQWKAVMGTAPWEEKNERDCPQCPATEVSWEDAQEFLQRMTASSTSMRFRLPTEAEWEYAARAGTQSAWSFGDELEMLANYSWYRGNTCDDLNDLSECFLHEVGLKLPNPWGLYDMHGGVYEWVFDWCCREYTEDPQVDPIYDQMPIYDDPDRLAPRARRGGAFATDHETTRPGWRAGSYPGSGWNDEGFRVAGTPTSTQVSPTTWGLIKQENQPPTQPPR